LTRRTVVLLTLVGLFIIPCELLAQKGPPASLLRSDIFDLQSALQLVAARFFPPQRIGPLYFIEFVERIELHGDGIEYERYTVKREGAHAGSFVRMKLVGDSSTVVDIACKLDGETLIDVVPLRIPMLEGAPCPLLMDVIGSFKGLEPAAFAEAIAGYFHALLFVGRIAGRKDDSPAMTEEMSKALYASLPKPTPKLPSFSVKTIDGNALTADKLRGKPALFVFGSCSFEQSRDLQATIAAMFDEFRGKLTCVTILDDDPETLAVFEQRGGRLFGHTVSDFHLDIQKAFRVPTVPYVLGYDGKGALRLRLLHKGDKETKKAVRNYWRTVSAGR